MTKVKILGIDPTEKKKLKLVKCLQTRDAEFITVPVKELYHYSEIIKISQFSYDGFDLFMCIPECNPKCAEIWLGYFNDGVI